VKRLEGDLEALVTALADGTDGASGRDIMAIVDAAQRVALARAMRDGILADVVLRPGDFRPDARA
jgi:hypothetical protein